MQFKYPACLGALFTALLLWSAHTEYYACAMPAVTPHDLSSLLAQPCWSQADYQTLAEQTGLFPAALDILRERDALNTVPEIQRAYLTPAVVQCTVGIPATRSEHMVDIAGCPAALEDGDILITPCTHILGFRSGHAALVVDAQMGITLEAVVIGQVSSLQNIQRWSDYASFAVYRLRGASQQTRSAIAQTACRRLLGVPYSLTVGWYPAKRMPSEVSATQCAHLVWEAYAAFGYDLDANGGSLVTPADLANSPLLELKQVYHLPFHWQDAR